MRGAGTFHTQKFVSQKLSLKELFTPQKPSLKEIFTPPRTSLKNVFTPKRTSLRNIFTEQKTSLREITTKKAPTLKEIFKQPVEEAVKEKTGLDKVVEIGVQPISTPFKIRKIIKSTIGEKPNASLYRSLTNWVWNSWRSISWGFAIKVSVTVGIIVGTVFLGGGSWLALLTALKYAGINVLPGILAKSIANVVGKKAVDITVEKALSLVKTNRRVKRILESKMPTSYARPLLSRLGVNVNNITPENIARSIINSGVTVATTSIFTYGAGALSNLPYGLLTDLFISNGISMGIAATKTVVTEGAKTTAKAAKKTVSTVGHVVKEMDRVKQYTSDKILNGEGDVVETVGDIINDIEEHVPKKAEKIRKFSVKKPREKTESTYDIRRTLAENKTMAIAGTAALSFVALAMTGNAEKLATIMSRTLGNVPEIAAKLEGAAKRIDIPGISLLTESKMAQTFVVKTLLNKVGVDKLIDIFAQYLTPETEAKIRSLSSRIRKEKDKTKVNRMAHSLLFLLVTGGSKYYDIFDLKKANMNKLKSIFALHYPGQKIPTNKDSLMVNILKAQDMKVGRISSLISGVISESLKSATASLVVEGMGTVKDMLNKIEEHSIVEEKPLAEEGIVLDKEKMAEEARKLKLETQKAAREAAKAEIEMRKAAKAELKRLQSLRHQEALERLKERVETRDVLTAALNVQQLRDMNTVIVNEDGTAAPIPTEEQLLPEAQREVLEKMGSFTPLMQTLTKETLKSTTNWIPGIGWINSGIQAVNVGLEVADLVKDIGKIGEIATSIAEGHATLSEEAVEDIAMLDRLGSITKLRIPSLSDAIDGVIKTDQKRWVDVYKRAAIDGIMNDWDTKRVMFEVGKQVLGNPTDLSIDVVSMVGEETWNKLFG